MDMNISNALLGNLPGAIDDWVSRGYDRERAAAIAKAQADLENATKEVINSVTVLFVHF